MKPVNAPIAPPMMHLPPPFRDDQALQQRRRAQTEGAFSDIERQSSGPAHSGPLHRQLLAASPQGSPKPQIATAPPDGGPDGPEAIFSLEEDEDVEFALDGGADDDLEFELDIQEEAPDDYVFGGGGNIGG